MLYIYKIEILIFQDMNNELVIRLLTEFSEYSHSRTESIMKINFRTLRNKLAQKSEKGPIKGPLELTFKINARRQSLMVIEKKKP